MLAKQTKTFELIPGQAPLLISMPHIGTFLPSEIAARLTEPALRLPDTDWHLDRLYDFVGGLDASLLRATHSRYVVDLNRPPDDASLYPGQDTTGLCPLDTFDREPLYRKETDLDRAEIEHRVQTYWVPYHSALQGELQRLRARHGRVVLWDAHSIRSVLPRFFEGRLPDLNLGSASATACAPELAHRLLHLAASDARYSSVLDGRFKGGYITRRYGRPFEQIHAVQLELAQLTYMQESYPYAFDDHRAGALRLLLRRMLNAALDWVRGF